MNSLPQQLKTLPSTSGVYLFKDAAGRVLYVGKAKRLRSRVRSYFRPGANLDPAKQSMIPKITQLETIATDTETEALVLEANLIRKHQPPYNVILRDDKFYLFIKITTGEQYPRVFPVRRIKKDRARYFGPYSSAAAVRNTLKLLRRIFPYKGEKESPREKIFPHPLFSQTTPSLPQAEPPLLRKEGKALSSPYQGEVPRQGRGGGVVDQETYHHNITQIIRFLSGHREEIIATLRAGMKKAAAARYYERAAIFRDQLHAIGRLDGNQKVFLPRKESFDVVSLAQHTIFSAANVFQIRGGKLLGKHTFLLRHRRRSARTDILRQFLLQYYRVAQDIPGVILIPQPLPDQAAMSTWINIAAPPVFHAPQRGKKKQLLAMGELNARQLLHQEQAATTTASQARGAMAELAQLLNLPEAKRARPPKPWRRRVETYDISNIQGQLATGSMVVFKDGQPDRNSYRKFKIKAVSGPDDYRMLQEVLHRRFGKHQSDWPVPDLIIIDGGRGQLSAAQKALHALQINLPLIALAKREETIFMKERGDIKEIQLPYDSAALYLVQRMRDEAHRFTLTYHRLLRSKQSRRSLLDEVPGIGPATKQRLLRHFGSLKSIRTASDTELTQLIGTAKTRALRDYL